MAFLEALRSAGIEYLFLNTGTDYAPIIEALAEMRASGEDSPKDMVVPHEMPAVSMAHGYFAVSGRPQVVMVHTIPGTANAISGLLNAYSSKVPLILVAGRSPITEEGVFGGKDNPIHWNQELRDQAGMVRQFTKWDWEHRSNRQIGMMVERAYEIAMTDPKGPVHIILPREPLCEPVHDIDVNIKPEPSAAMEPPDEIVNEAAKILVEAENPLIITNMLGRKPEAVHELVSFAELLSIPVIQGFYYLNFPTNHPLHIGSQISLLSHQYIRSADVIFVVDVDVPWIPAHVKPKDGVKIIQLDVDPLIQHIPWWGFKAHLPMRGDSERTLRKLTAIAKKVSGARSEGKERLARFENIRRDHDAAKKNRSDEAYSHRKDKPIDPRWLSHCIGRVKASNSIIFSETVRSPFVDFVEFTEPGTIFQQTPFGALGWSLGAGLGGKLAQPGRDVLVLCGDGSYIYSVPTACHYVAMAYKLPVLTVVYNNQAWYASKRPVEILFPKGKAVTTGNFPGVYLEPSPRFDLIAKAFGAYTEMVEDPDEVEPALRRALDATRKERTQALLNVILKRP